MGLSNNVYSAFIILSGSKLQLLKPKNNIPKRAMWDEPEMKPTITSHVTVNISGATLMTVPENLPARKRWNRRFPLYIEWSGDELESRSIPTATLDTENEHSERVVGSPAVKVIPAKAEKKINAASDLIVKTSHGTKSVTIFTRTDRDKEELHRWLSKAIRPPTEESKRPSPSESAGTDDSPPPEADACELASNSRHRSPRLDKKQDDTFSVDSERTKRSDTSSLDLSTSDLPFHLNSLKSNDGFNLNFFLDRLFSQFLRDDNWREIVRKRIQKKLDLIKFPSFIDKLEASDLELGTSLPVIHRIAKPWIDSRGHWIELSITYSGGVKMTLETRINLMKLKKPEEAGAESVKPEEAENEDEEDEALHPMDSSDEEDAVGHDSEPSTEENGPSAKTKLVQYFTKITESHYFQRVAEVGIVRRAMEGVSNTRLFLNVELKSLSGDLILNIPPAPTDRLWYGFKGNPTLWLVAKPKVGERALTHTRITEFIEKRLILEFQKLLVLPNMDDMIIPILTAPQ